MRLLELKDWQGQEVGPERAGHSAIPSRPMHARTVRTVRSFHRPAAPAALSAHVAVGQGGYEQRASRDPGGGLDACQRKRRRAHHDLAPAGLVVPSLLLLLAPTKTRGVKKKTAGLQIRTEFNYFWAHAFCLFLDSECQEHAHLMNLPDCLIVPNGCIHAVEDANAGTEWQGRDRAHCSSRLLARKAQGGGGRPWGFAKASGKDARSGKGTAARFCFATSTCTADRPVPMIPIVVPTPRRPALLFRPMHPTFQKAADLAACPLSSTALL
jgi:hypothetical protein